MRARAEHKKEITLCHCPPPPPCVCAYKSPAVLFSLDVLQYGIEGLTVDPLTPKSDQHSISPYSNTAISNIKVVRRKEMINKVKKVLIV